MTNFYKATLEILSQILQEENYDHWAKWMQEDIELWETNKSVVHHLHAYGEILTYLLPISLFVQFLLNMYKKID